MPLLSISAATIVSETVNSIEINVNCPPWDSTVNTFLLPASCGFTHTSPLSVEDTLH